MVPSGMRLLRCQLLLFSSVCSVNYIPSIEDVDEIKKKYTAATSLLSVIHGVIARLEPPRAVLKGDLVRRYLLSPTS